MPDQPADLAAVFTQNPGQAPPAINAQRSTDQMARKAAEADSTAACCFCPSQPADVVVTTVWSNWVLFEVLEKEIQLQRLPRQQSLFQRPLSAPNNKLQDNCNTIAATVQPCCSSFATFAVPVNDSNKNSDDESTSNSAPTQSAKKVLPSPTHRHQAAGQKPKPSKNRYDAAFISQPENDDDCSSNSAPTETDEIATPSPTHRQPVAGHKPKPFRSKYDVTPSPTHRQQDTSQKRKPSKKRYDATLVSQPQDNDEYISKPTVAKTAEMEMPSPTLRQHVAAQKPKPSGNRYDAALVSQPAHYLPSSSKFDIGNVFNILRTRAARQTTTSKEPVSTLPRTKVSGNATQNRGTLPTAKQQHQPTSRRSSLCKAFCYPWHGEHQEVQAQTLSRQTFKIFHTGSCHIYKHVNINCVSK